MDMDDDDDEFITLNEPIAITWKMVKIDYKIV